MSNSKICRYCGQVIPKDAQNCEFCGRFLYKKADGDSSQLLVCSKCKATVFTDDNFCQYCGAVFNLPEDDDEENGKSNKRNKNKINYNIGILVASLAISITITLLMLSGNNVEFGKICGLFSVAFISAEIIIYIYLIPSIIAIENNHRNIYLIYIMNLLFGITIIGWFVTLIMSMNNGEKK